MQVVLLERIAKLGQMGDVVTVKDGYARNFLLPQGKALRANKANLEQFETQRAQLEADSLKLKTEAEAVKAKMDTESVVVIRQSSETGQLYGSVNTRDIAASFTEAGFTVNRNQVLLDAPIKELGVHDIQIILHPEVSADVQVNVARTEEEAERQARGENVTISAEEEETLDIEEVFEEGVEAELDDDAGEEAVEAAAEMMDAETAESSEASETAEAESDDTAEEETSEEASDEASEDV
ncbi:MAG: 50S ribosomal protein L9 [Parvibaculales bacterium]